MALIETLFFDIDDTLLDFTGGERRALRKTLTDLGLPADGGVIDRYHEINGECWRKLETGEYERGEVLIRRFSLLLSEMGREDIPAENVNKIYETYLSRECDYVPGAEKVLSELKNSYRMYGLSNGNAKIQRERQKLSGLDRYLRKIFISEEVGYHKPDKRFFDYCINKIGNIDRSKTLMIGDSVTSDIVGGINAGLKTCLVSKKQKPEGVKPDFAVLDISELTKLL